MQRLVISLVTTAGVLAVSSAAARLGEAQTQIEARYGKPYARSSPGGFEFHSYHKARIDIDVAYKNGKSVAEFYYKRDRQAMSETEIRVLMDANSAGSKWFKLIEGPDHPLWQNGLDYRAFYTNRKLTICTTRFMETVHAEHEASEKQKLKGF